MERIGKIYIPLRSKESDGAATFHRYLSQDLRPPGSYRKLAPLRSSFVNIGYAADQYLAKF